MDLNDFADGIALLVIGPPKPDDFANLAEAQVVAPYLGRTDVKVSARHGRTLFTAGSRSLDVVRDAGGWWAVRSWDGDAGADWPVRVHTRADLDAHVSWVAGG